MSENEKGGLNYADTACENPRHYEESTGGGHQAQDGEYLPRPLDLRAYRFSPDLPAFIRFRLSILDLYAFGGKFGFTPLPGIWTQTLWLTEVGLYF